jgi:hypothetical protein
MSTDEEARGSVKWGWFGTLAMIIMVAGTLTYFLLPKLLPETENDVIIIKATEGPLKIKPTDTGEKTIDHQDLLVVEILKNGERDDGQTETLRPGAASPEPPPVEEPAPQVLTSEDLKATISSAPTAPGTQVLDKIEGQGNVPLVDSPPVKTTDKTSDTYAEPTSQSDKSGQQSVTTNVTVKSEAEVTDAETRKAANALPQSKPKSLIKKRVIVIEGDAPLYMTQLAAFRSRAKALEIAGILSEKHKSRLGRAVLETMRVDTSTNGTFHRVVSKPMPRNDADLLCQALRRAGQDCFLRKYTPPEE